MLARELVFCRGKGGLSTGVRQVIVSVGGLDRGGEVLVGGHEGGQHSAGVEESTQSDDDCID